MAGCLGNLDLEDALFSVPPSTFFRGRNRLLGNRVLVRRFTLDPAAPAESRDAFFRAQRHAADLVHPAIFRPTDILEEQGFLWTLHEFHANHPSDDVVRRGGATSVVDAAHVGAQIGDALAYIHRRGFVHGKVSPHEVVVGADGRAFLLSLTKSAELAAGHWPLPPETLSLTPFSTPEEFSGARPDAASDAYALAGTLFFWLTGKFPRGGSSAEEALERARSGAPVPDLRDWVPEVPAPLSEAVRAALDADPARRRGSCAALASRCDEVYRHLMAEIPSGSGSGTRLRLFGGDETVQVLSRHGAGAFGVVFKACDDAHRILAVKALRPEHRADSEARQRFLREAESVRGIDHPSVVRIRGVGEQDGTPFVVMDFIEGPDLATLLRKDGVFPPARAALMVAHVARGLAAIHDHGIVHRDLKPHNILVRDGAVPIITDFGVAMDRNASRLTLTGDLVGTPAYMAPEQVEGNLAGPAADIHALGAILFELLTGTPPYTQPDMVGTLRSIRQDPVPELPADVPAALAGVVRRLLAKCPEDRYRTAAEAAERLDHAAASLVSGGQVPEDRWVGPLHAGRDSKEGLVSGSETFHSAT